MLNIKQRSFILTAAFAITGGLCAAFGYLYANHKILKQSAGELVVEENGTDTPNLYLRFVNAKDLNMVRTSECVVCKVVKADMKPKIFKGKNRTINEA